MSLVSKFSLNSNEGKELAPSLLAFVLALIVLWTSYIQVKPPTNVIVNRTPLLTAKGLNHLSFGYSELLADTLWLRVIQDFEVCGQQSVIDGEMVGIFGSFKLPACDSGWSFSMLDGISELAPRFRIVYALGAAFLSIVVDDRIGADRLFEKGVKAYPNDWPILYRAGYHKIFEMNQVDAGAKLMHQASLNGAPQWLTIMSARLYTEAGRAEVGRQVLLDFLSSMPREKWPQKALDRLREIDEQLAKAKAKR